MGTERKKKKSSLLRRSVRHLSQFVLPRWPVALVALVALGGAVAFDLLKPWPLKFVFDYLLVDESFMPSWLPAAWDTPHGMLIAVCMMIIAIFSLSSIAGYFREYLLKRIGEEIAFELRVSIFRHIQQLSLRFHDTKRIGDIITRVTSDIKSIRELATTSVLTMITAVATLIGLIGMMLWMDWRLATVSLVIVPILGPIVVIFKSRIEKASKDRKKREVEISSVTQETMSSIRLVKTFGREKMTNKQFGRESSEAVRAGLRVAKLESAYVRCVDAVVSLGTCAVIYWGVQRIWTGLLTPGELIVFVAYQRQIYSPIRDMAKQTAKIAKGKISLERVLEIFETEAEVVEMPNAIQAPRFKGTIEFEGVHFAYNAGNPVLHDVNFKVEPGMVVALVGHSGAGKSTILNLIPRLYDTTEGRVLIDGEDIKSFKLQSLRDQVSFVLQDSVLLQTSILENIMYGRPDADRETVRKAADAALVEQVVERLPAGYDTVVGPRGATLSGGERQRVAIARAMVRDTPILVLDEPTTGLDVEAETLVMEALARLMKDKTTFVISHKLRLIERADLILVIDKGRIVAAGSHRELIEQGGLYARLHAMGQSNGGQIAEGGVPEVKAKAETEAKTSPGQAAAPTGT